MATDFSETEKHAIARVALAAFMANGFTASDVATWPLARLEKLRNVAAVPGVTAEDIAVAQAALSRFVGPGIPFPSVVPTDPVTFHG